MSARSKARKRALDVLYQADLRQASAEEVLEAEVDTADRPVNEYTRTLVLGVVDNQARIDELLATYAQGWSLDRMPAVDRNLLRLGVFEILYVDDTPDAVAIAEAVNLARDLSTEESPTFVNGLLARILDLKPHLAAN